jgi:uncharacterized protein
VSERSAPPGRALAWLGFMGLLALIAYAGRIGGGEPDRDVLYSYSVFVGAVLQYAVMLGILLWIAKGLPKREVFALRRPSTGIWATIGLTAGTLVGIFVI